MTAKKPADPDDEGRRMEVEPEPVGENDGRPEPETLTVDVAPGDPGDVHSTEITSGGGEILTVERVDVTPAPSTEL